MSFLHGAGLQHLIATWGILFLFCVIFAETGLLIGFFLPGDSLLFLAGAMAAQPGNHLNIATMIVALCVAAIAGNFTGYFVGRSVGDAVLHRPNSRLFKREHVERTHAFYEKHGNKAIVLARFVPIVRTFVTTIAGVGRMDLKAFMTYSIIGGIGWICSMSLMGYFLGGIPVVKAHFEHVTLLIVFLSIVPMIMHYLQERKKS